MNSSVTPKEANAHRTISSNPDLPPSKILKKEGLHLSPRRLKKKMKARVDNEHKEEI
jgi:hypothetical protein